MKMTALAVVLAATAGMSMNVNAANQGSGSLTFKGSIIEAPCSINPNSSNQEVDLGQVNSAQLKNSGTSTPQNFQINLENCALTKKEDGTTIAPTLKLTFGGAPAVAGNSSWFGITGNASGAGIVITDAASNKIPVGGLSVTRSLLEGSNTLSFSAYLQGIGSTVTPGNFQSIVDFILAYE
ncbi:MAG: Fimbria A protein [Candidatus Erwinia impunctatus]|nr:Fimbria A protein [Culicoides impunctatus]